MGDLRMILVLLAAVAWQGCEAGGSSVGDDDDDDDSAVADDDDSAVADDDDDTTPLDPPDWCEPAILGELQDVTTTPAAQYLVNHPEDGAVHVPIVIFLPGGNGARGAGTGVFSGFMSDGYGVGQVRSVVPYAADGSLLDEYDRTLDILDEVLQCYGGDPDHVHLAGTSNGGMGAFELMVDSPEPFTTLTGAPGLFTGASEDELVTALEGKAVLNAVGSLDSGWVPAVEATHAHLVSLGIDSTLHVWEGQGHIPDDDFDPTPLFDFWLAH